MLKLICLIVLLAVTPPILAAKRVTVDQLQQLLLAQRGHQDAQVARALSNLQLTEALRPSKLASWQADLPGSEARQALTLLADESAFLDPPSRDLPSAPTPGLAEQRIIMALAVSYVSNTLHQLPNFFATRETLHYEDTPQSIRENELVPSQPLHPVSSSSATVTYRDDEEAMDAAMDKTPQTQTGLNTYGEFGNILKTTLLDGGQGSLAWSHWEQGEGGPEAVFRYTVPREKSHYRLTFCCVSQGNGIQTLEKYSGYHGQIAVDPASGAILRLTLEADLKQSDGMLKADILVDYAPVEIGDKKYVCPVRSISVSVVPAEEFHPNVTDTGLGAFVSAESLRTSKASNTDGALVLSNPGALKNLLNEVTFTQYHLFRADARVLNGDATPPPADTLPTPQTSKTIAADSNPAVSAPPPASEKPQPAAAAPPSPTVASVDKSPAPRAELTPPPSPVLPEISVVAATRIPALPPATSPSGFTLHAAARLVDMTVVAYNAKGLPVTDLKANDLELLDNGRPQKIRIAAYPGDASASASAATNNGSASQISFSNQPPNSLATNNESANDGPARSEPSVTVLLIDSANLSWSDFSNAREQMLPFLLKLPAGQQVAIYILKADSFQVLQDQTADHFLLAAKLSQWMPKAVDLSQVQEEERRNRQQMDYVRHKADLQYVNGNMINAPETFLPPDPQLRDYGGNPGRDALTILVGVARHLAAVPGHKDLVWITSDNVLADWTGKAVGSDKGSKQIGGFAIHAQEALNEAHIALFPLDASQLEGGGVGADLQNASVEVDPGAVDPPGATGNGKQPALNTSNSRGAPGGRNLAAMEQDVHAIQGPIREMADATGGRALRRSSDMVSALNHVVEEGRATYLLSFVPDTAADNKYHPITLKLTARRGVTLRYRTGYLASTEASSFQERFQQALWQPVDMDGIVMSATPSTTGDALTVKLQIAADDLALEQQNGRWVDKLDLFFAQRDNQDRSAHLTGQAIALALTPATYQKIKTEGLPFNQTLNSAPDMGSIRVLVVDENSGRIGSITLPASSIQGQSRR
jgi:VWFA-related protein